jgi:hypothetical protein
MFQRNSTWMQCFFAVSSESLFQQKRCEDLMLIETLKFNLKKWHTYHYNLNVCPPQIYADIDTNPQVDGSRRWTPGRWLGRGQGPYKWN